MVWATVSSQCCFCWLYRASPSLPAKKNNQSDFVVDHLVLSMCRVFSCFVGNGLVRPFTVIRYIAPLLRLVSGALSISLLMSMLEAFSVCFHALIKLCYTKAVEWWNLVPSSKAISSTSEIMNPTSFTVSYLASFYGIFRRRWEYSEL